MNHKVSSEIDISIVGGTGKMGLLFAKSLKNKVSKLTISSRDPKRAKEAADKIGVGWTPLDEVHKSHVVIISVPMEQTVNICCNLSQKMLPNSLIIDLASVKTGITDIIAKSIPPIIEYLSLHPLFGPQVEGISGKRIIAIEGRGGIMTEKFLKLISDCGAFIKKASIKEHDNAMASVQVLHHYALLTFATVLSRIAPPEGLSEYVTESLEKTLQNLQNMLANWETIYSIQERNPFAKSARKSLAETATELVVPNPIAKNNLQNAILLLKSPYKPRKTG